MASVRIARGCRRLTDAHIHVEALSKEFHGLPEGVSKGQALSTFKRASQMLGISPRLRDALDVLFAFSKQEDWEVGSRPIVWPSNRTLGNALCLGERQVQNVLNGLIRACLITPVDSPTGKRWGQRDTRSGKITEAYGFDLSPVGMRFREFVALSERSLKEERERAALRRRLTIARKAIGQIGETALEYGLSDRDWEKWVEEALALAHTVVNETAIPSLIRVVTALEERRHEGEAALAKALAERRPCGESEEISPRGEENFTRNTSTTHPLADTSATGKNDSGEWRSGGRASSSSPDPNSHKHPQGEKRSPEELPAITPRFVLNVSSELKSYIATDLPNWSDIVEAANRIRQELGISRTAWVDACQAMGRYQAATAVAVIAAKADTIHSPGGYLRGMTGRACDGELHLNKSLWGIARREWSSDRA